MISFSSSQSEILFAVPQLVASNVFIYNLYRTQVFVDQDGKEFSS